MYSWAKKIKDIDAFQLGETVEQKVNGKISYIPPVQDKNKFQYRMKVDSDGQ